MTREVSRLCVTGTSAVTDTEKGRQASGEIPSEEGEPGHLQRSPGAFPISGLQAEAVPSDGVYSDI